MPPKNSELHVGLVASTVFNATLLATVITCIFDEQIGGQIITMSDTDDTSVTGRRNVLKSVGTVGFGAVSATLLDADIVHGRRPEQLESSEIDWSADGSSEDVFPLSVVSGGPTDSGAILSTKVAENAYGSGESVYVQVANDEEFADPIYEGEVLSDSIKAENNYVVKVDLDGELPSDQHLYYRFHHAGTTSQTGRCRTLPTPGASADQVRLAVVSCQKFQSGYYPAYNYIAEEDIDYMLHLGDQIYESAGDSEFEGRSIELPSGHDVVWGLEDYRHLWDTYRGDEFFQRALMQHTFIPGWDDHEFINNPFWDYENDRPWSDDHPRNDDAEFMTQLFIDAIQAWWEYNPARVEYDPSADHPQDRIHMWRSIRFGDLLELPVTDERLFRSMPPGGDAAGRRQGGIPPNAPEADDGDRTMLGFEQREWLLETLKETDATWKGWANEVPFVPLWRSDSDDDQFKRDYDNWDGYEHERAEIVGQFTHFDVDNFVTLTGDMHNYLVAYILNGWESVENRTPIPRDEELVGIELMTPALSSESDPSDFWSFSERTTVESESPALTSERHQEVMLEENPHLAFFNSKYNGYSIAEFTPDACTWTTYAVDDTIDEPEAARGVLREYRIPEGTVELEELEANDSPLPEEQAGP
jgi:alkaline phosphatase D